MDIIPWRHKRERRDLSRRSDSLFPRLRSDIDRLFDRFFEDFTGEGERGLAPGAFGPRLDLAESDEDITLTAELPGVDPQNVEVCVEGGILTIRGQKRDEREEKQGNYYFAERQFGSFQRSIHLPSSVDPQKVEATFKNGVLTVTLAKRPEAKPKPIEIHVK